ncbi:MAG: hypothetical protein UR26_C0007G0012 [candidate division TM6 bacterium GW2011_GWF2_32_72]|nr:MAG: hypothetical protein UR26_C0007G0012 [candidate division TM6 bacterium GW2011_GWF2_32_72]
MKKLIFLLIPLFPILMRGSEPNKYMREDDLCSIMSIPRAELRDFIDTVFLCYKRVDGCSDFFEAWKCNFNNEPLLLTLEKSYSDVREAAIIYDSVFRVGRADCLLLKKYLKKLACTVLDRCKKEWPNVYAESNENVMENKSVMNNIL